MIRNCFLSKLTYTFTVNPVVALLGPRQCGKTTLARQFKEQIQSEKKVTVFDLEDPIDLGRLQNPSLVLGELEGLIILDEIQRLPGLFEVLRVLVDRKKPGVQFLILGSASRDLIRQSSETLAGRISYLEVTPFTLEEAGRDQSQKLWVRGGFPRSFLADDERISSQWREDYIRTYLERDIPQLGIRIPAATLRRFWMMLAHYHGQIFNATDLGRSLSVADTTIKHYLDILTGTFMVRALQPWYENVSKRQVKRPKIYFKDSGIFHQLLGCGTKDLLDVHPKLGASWEGFAVEQVIRLLGLRDEESFFWSVHQQMELDLMAMVNGSRIGFEFKFSEKPAVPARAPEIIDILGLKKLFIIGPADADYPVSQKIHVMGLSHLTKERITANN